MDGIESKTAQINSNRISVNNKSLQNSFEKIWKIDPYGTTTDANPSLQPRNEKKTLDILKKTVTKIDGH